MQARCVLAQTRVQTLKVHHEDGGAGLEEQEMGSSVTFVSLKNIYDFNKKCF